MDEEDQFFILVKPIVMRSAGVPPRDCKLMLISWRCFRRLVRLSYSLSLYFVLSS